MRGREEGGRREGKEGNWLLNTLTLENAKIWVCSLLKILFVHFNTANTKYKP